MPPTSILIAEDQKPVAQELKERLEGLGYLVLGIASSGEEAINETEKLRPQIVLMNIHLKGTRDGIQTGSLIHDYHETPLVYIIDSSSWATIRRAGISAPFGYIFRPFDDKQILAVVEAGLIRYQLERKLRQSWQWLNTTLTSIGEGVIATDERGLVRFINPIAGELTGWSHTDAIGKSIFEIFSLVDEKSRELVDISGIKNKMLSTVPKRSFEGLLLPRSGLPVPVEANITSIKDGKGIVHGMVLVFRDVTQQRKAIQEIKHQANRAEALMQVASQLNSHLELATVLKTICTITNRTIKATGTAVFLRDTKEDAFHTKQDVFRGMAATSEDKGLKAYHGSDFEIPSELLKSLLSRENPVVVIQEVQSFPNLPYSQIFNELNIKTLAIAALFRGHELAGALIAIFAQEHMLPVDETTLLGGLADQASSAIENAELFEQIRAGRERQRKLAKSLVDIQEAERRHIAKELHDHLGQILTGLQFMLETTKNQAIGPQRSNLEEIQDTVTNIIEQVREMSLRLRPSMLDDMGLLPTLLWHIDRYISQTGIHVNFQSDELPERLSTEVEIAAYRIIQEALTNVARHANVKDVFVGLVVHDDTLWVEVVDKGKGFDALADSDRPTSGLGGMRERASMVGGYLVIDSFINLGTQILAALPLTEKPLERRKNDRYYPSS